MKLTKRGVIAIVAGGATVVLALGIGGAVVAVDLQGDAQATAAYETAAEGLREAAADRATAADEGWKARTEALTARNAATALVAAADPGMLADPATRDALAATIPPVDGAAGFVAGADGVIPAPKKPAAATLPAFDPPKEREERIAAAAELDERAQQLRDEAEELGGDAARIRTPVTALQKAASAVVASANAKGAGLAVPDLASQETKDAFAASVAALAKPKAGADLAALVTAYQGAWAAVLASSDEAARSQDPATIEPTYINGILVVNKTYGLPSWYGDGLTAETLDAFAAMQADAAALGYDLYIASGFRSYWSQESIYNRYVAADGQAAADRYSARPGHSEHQTGLTFDLNCICEDFGYQADGQWVAANAHLYGFIVRYPPGKEGVTGYIWEPLHLRYLGVDVATAVYNSGLSLEEYLGITSSYG